MQIIIFELLCGLHRVFLYRCDVHRLPPTGTKAYGPFSRSRRTGIIFSPANITLQKLEHGGISQRLRWMRIAVRHLGRIPGNIAPAA